MEAWAYGLQLNVIADGSVLVIFCVVCVCVRACVHVHVFVRACVLACVHTDKLKLVYCWIPKVACTSWKMWLRQLHNDPNAKDLMSTHRVATNNMTEVSVKGWWQTDGCMWESCCGLNGCSLALHARSRERTNQAYASVQTK